MERDLSKAVPKIQASILGLLSTESRTQTIITQRLTTAGFKDKESREDALKQLLNFGEVKKLGNIVPFTKKTPSTYELTELGHNLIDMINGGKVEMDG